MLDRPLLIALNHLLRQEPWARQRLRPFAGRGVRISLPPLVNFDLTVAEDGAFHGGPLTAPDVQIRLPEHAPLRFLGRPQEALAAARLEGAADFAEALGFVFRNLRWDAEEDLARFVGDIPARRLAGLGQTLLRWQGQAVARLAANVGEFVIQEQPGLLHRRDMQRQQDGVAQVASRTEALAARLDNLPNRPHGI